MAAFQPGLDSLSHPPLIGFKGQGQIYPGSTPSSEPQTASGGAEALQEQRQKGAGSKSAEFRDTSTAVTQVP